MTVCNVVLSAQICEYSSSVCVILLIVCILHLFYVIICLRYMVQLLFFQIFCCCMFLYIYALLTIVIEFVPWQDMKCIKCLGLLHENLLQVVVYCPTCTLVNEILFSCCPTKNDGSHLWDGIWSSLLNFHSNHRRKANCVFLCHGWRRWPSGKASAWRAADLGLIPTFTGDLFPGHRLIGLVVKASASRAEGPGFESRLHRDFFGVESYQ